jgi:inosine/xanthosine triphosphate pyrophosphatase family protein
MIPTPPGPRQAKTDRKQNAEAYTLLVFEPKERELIDPTRGEVWGYIGSASMGRQGDKYDW